MFCVVCGPSSLDVFELQGKCFEDWQNTGGAADVHVLPQFKAFLLRIYLLLHFFLNVRKLFHFIAPYFCAGELDDRMKIVLMH